MFDDTEVVATISLYLTRMHVRFSLKKHFDRLSELPEDKGEAVVRHVPAHDTPEALAVLMLYLPCSRMFMRDAMNQTTNHLTRGKFAKRQILGKLKNLSLQHWAEGS